MNFFTYLFFFCSLVYLYLTVFIFEKNPKSSLNRMCSLIFLCLALWSFSDVFIYNHYTTIQTARFFNKLGSIGWIVLFISTLLFALAFTEKKKLLKSRLLYIIILPLPLLLLYNQLNESAIYLVNDNNSRQYYGWTCNYTDSAWVYIYYSYLLVYLTASLYLILNYWRNCSELYKKKQSLIIFFTGIIGISLGSITGIILPEMDIYLFPNLTNVIMLIWATGIIYAMTRYRLFLLTPSTAAENIIKTMSDAFFLVTVNKTVQNVNSSLIRILDYEEKEIIGKPLANFIRKKKTDNSFIRLLVKNPDSISEISDKETCDREIPVLLSTSTLRDENGKSQGYICIARDITELKNIEFELERHQESLEVIIQERSAEIITINKELQAENEERRRAINRLVESKQHFFTMFENSRDMMLVIESNGKAILANPAFNNKFTIVTELSDNLVRYFHPEDRKRIIEAWRLYLKDGMEFTNIEFRCKYLKGEYIYLNTTVRKIEVSGETFYYCVARDITRGILETKKLRESEERYRALFDNSTDMVYLHDLKGNFLDANSAALKTLGYSRKEIQSVNFASLFGVDSIKEIFSAIREIKKADSSGKVYEFRINDRNGRPIDIEVMASLVSKGDKPYAIQGIARDVTLRKRLDEQVSQSQKLEAIGTLAGGIAHDFNNLLGTIFLSSDLVKMTIPEDSPQLQSMHNIVDASKRARELIKQILIFSRQSSQEKKPLDIRPIAKETLKFLRTTLPSTIEIHEKTDLDPGAILADPTQVHQVIMNLCTNASRAMNDGHGVMELFIEHEYIDKSSVREKSASISSQSVQRTGKFLKLTISDTGIGIEPDILDRIYEPFFTTRAIGEGNGLGLSVVHGIVKDHNGFITVDSRLGKGTTFKVYFPIIEDISLAKTDDVQKTHTGSESILFVDDEEIFSNAISGVMKSLGYSVKAETDSIKALEEFKRFPEKYDLLMTDQTMPGMTGLELAREVKNIRNNIPIILISGNSESFSEESLRKSGIEYFSMKPFSTKEISAIIREALEQGK